MTIQRTQTRPTGWTAYVCSECQAQWDLHAHENPKDIEHTAEECTEEKVAQEELRALLARHPGQTFARSALNGSWLPV
jgi:hypothetical protein